LQEVKVERFHRGVIAMESGAGWGELWWGHPGCVE
jgi:hypothetical protein